MTQNYDSADSQISKHLIPSLTLYQLHHCAYYVHYFCKYDVVDVRAPFFLAWMKPKSNILEIVRVLAECWDVPLRNF